MNPENLKSSDVASVLMNDSAAPTPVPLNGITYIYKFAPGAMVIGLAAKAAFNSVVIF